MMTKHEWYDLIEKEFGVSRKTAKTIFSKMCEIKEIKEVNTMHTMAAAIRKAGVNA